MICSWLAGLRAGDKPLSASYVFALHNRLSEILTDAVSTD